MSYAIKEIFYSIQGEGENAGMPAVFVRFAGCNLWSGREADRAGATCKFCDTDFLGGDKYALPGDVLAAVSDLHGSSEVLPLIVLTGGEPALQADGLLVAALKGYGYRVAIETNGTQSLPPGLDHVCVSPKAGTRLAVASGDELKLVFPQFGLEPASLEHLGFRRFYLQPMDGPDYRVNLDLAIRYCLANPKWRLSAQAHKTWGVR